MCHLRKFTYSCGHSDTIVVSPCRQTTFKIKRSNAASPAEKWLRMKEAGKLKLRWKGREQILNYIPACRPSPSLCLAVKQICGVCLFDQQMGEWGTRIEAMQAKVAEARGLWGADDGLLEGLEQDLENLMEQRGVAEWRCRQEFPTTRHTLPLKKDRLGIKINCGSPLRAELMSQDLDFEKEPELRAIDEQGIPYTTFWDFFSDRYLWMGPVIDWTEVDADQFDHDDNASNSETEPHTSIVLRKEAESTEADHGRCETGPLLETRSKFEFLALGPNTIEHRLQVDRYRP